MTATEIQRALPNLGVPDTPLEALPGAKVQPRPAIIVAGDLVRVSASDKVGDIILNISAEGVPALLAATLMVEFVATLKAAEERAGLPTARLPEHLPSPEPTYSSAPDPIAETQSGVDSTAIAPLPEPPGGIADAVSPEILERLRQSGVPVPEPVKAKTNDMVQVIPAADLLHLRRADTESGIHRVKFFTKKFNRIGIICWEEQENEDVPKPLAGILDVGTINPGMEYKIPAKVKGLKVRFKPAQDASKRPQPDRVLEVLT